MSENLGQEQATKDSAAKWRSWLARINARKDAAERSWWKMAEKANAMYSPKTEDAATNPFNILYANTEVLLPSLYSATPRPDVAVRHEAPSAPAEAAEGLLKVVIDDNSPGMESFDSAMEGATLSALVPGMGGVRLRAYPGEPHPLRWEEYKYNQMIWGYAKKWSRVPWVAFLHPVTKEDIVTQFSLSAEQAAQIKVPSQEDQDTKDADKGEKCPFLLIELWIKANRQTVWLLEDYSEVLLESIDDDPLALAGFYPTPGPLTLVRKPTDMDPTPLYEYYRKQAEELNRVSTRLNKILEAIKVRGAYNPVLGKTIGNILSSDDMENALVPAEVPMDMAKGIEGQIYLLPIEKLIQVAQQLYMARESIQNVIQQITGLADIVRGASVASETATAQTLKNKWGTIRLRRLQKVVAQYSRDLLRLAIDAGTTVIPPEGWRQMTGLPFPMAQEKAMAQQQVQQQMQMYMQQQMLQQAQMGPPGMPPSPGMPPPGQPPGQPPGPPQPPPVDPKLQAILSQPTWEDILKLLSDDAGRCYIIDIETSSTIDADASADKQEAGEFMQAFAQLVQGIQPMVQLGPTGVNAAKAIVSAVCKRFKLGREVDEALSALQPPPPQMDPAAQVKLEIEKLKLQGAQQQHEMDKEEFDLKKKEMLLKHQIAVAELEAKDRALKTQAQVDMATTSMQLQASAIQHQQGMEQANTGHAQKMEQNQAAHQAKVAQAQQQQKAAKQPPRKPA
jgi:hypothetical protein